MTERMRKNMRLKLINLNSKMMVRNKARANQKTVRMEKKQIMRLHMNKRGIKKHSLLYMFRRMQKNLKILLHSTKDFSINNSLRKSKLKKKKLKMSNQRKLNR